MTQKFIGEIKLADRTVSMPTGTKIPKKSEWHSYSIWEFNGKRYRPLTQKAEDNLAAVVSELQKQGAVGAAKVGKRKLSSVKYAVLTTGVEQFELVFKA